MKIHGKARVVVGIIQKCVEQIFDDSESSRGSLGASELSVNECEKQTVENEVLFTSNFDSGSDERNTKKNTKISAIL